MIRFALILIVLLAVGSQAVAAVKWNNSENKSSAAAASISIPQYFFANSINQNCLMSGKHEHLSFRAKRSPLILDLTKEENFQWMDKLKFYNWKSDHDERSDSLDVYMEQLTNRMNFLNATLDNAIIQGRLNVQAELAIKLIVTYAENNLMLESTSIPEIKAMRKKGTFNKCYQGKGNTKAVCHWHTAQEASRFAGQITIAALKVRPFMDEASSKIIGNYLKILYKKFSQPYQDNSNKYSRDKNQGGFYQMGNASFSVLAYAAYTQDKKLAYETFEETYNYIDKILLEDGFIVNNSFRGVRGYWYHTLGLNNILGFIAVAEEWNYPLDDDFKHRVSKAVEQMELGATDIEAYHAQWIDKFNAKTYRLKFAGRDIYVGNSSLNEKDARYHIHQQAPFIDYLSERYSDADVSFFNQTAPGVETWENKKYGAYYDRMLGFNPKCIP
tara:strand:+ start:1575 stop:2903 length:1329 start_codon:yes stop_codon:yes gene_type:complete